MQHEGIGGVEGPRRVYGYVNKGAIDYWVDKVKKQARFFRGSLKGVGIVWDPGGGDNSAVKPHWRLGIVLGTEIDGEDAEMVLVCTYRTTWTWMFASYLENISAGEKISIHAFPAGTNEKVSLVKVMDYENAAAIARVEMPGSSEDREPTHQRAEEIIRAHASYNAMRIPRYNRQKDMEDRPARTGDTGPQQPQTAAPGQRQAPSHAVPYFCLSPCPDPDYCERTGTCERFPYGQPGATPTEEAQAATPSEPPPKALKPGTGIVVFGYELKKLPEPEEFIDVADQTTREYFEGALHDVGIGPKDTFLAARVIMRAIGEAGVKWITVDHILTPLGMTMGDVIWSGKVVRNMPDIFKKTLRNQVQMERKTAAEAAALLQRKPSPEYDPFADE